jgi:hypothetical protein
MKWAEFWDGLVWFVGSGDMFEGRRGERVKN